MPAALPIDWGPIKIEWVAGTPASRLAEKYGVSHDALRQRICREKWAELRPKVHVASVTEALQTASKSIAIDWAQKGLEHRSAMQRLTSRLVQHAENLDDEIALAKIEKLKTLDDIARRNIGLDEPTSPTINLAFGVLEGGQDDFAQDANIVELETENDGNPSNRSLTDGGG